MNKQKHRTPNEILYKPSSNEKLEMDCRSTTTTAPPRPGGTVAGTFLCRKRPTYNAKSCPMQNTHTSELHPPSELSMPSADSKGSRRGPRVNFHPDVRGRTFEVDMSDRRRMFYSSEEMRALQEQTRADVKLLRQLQKKERRAKATNNDDGGDDNNATSPLTPDERMTLDAIPIRGIDHFVSKRGWAERTEKQREAIYAVLDEQEYLKEIGRNGDDLAIQRIASVSSNYSLEARTRASALGRQDADDMEALRHDNSC